MLMLSADFSHVHPEPARTRTDFSDCPNDMTVYDSADDFPDWTDAVAVGVPVSPAGSSWWLGFQLGLEGIPAAAPGDMYPDQRAAFIAGHSIGIARYYEDCDREHHDAMDRFDWAFSDPWDLLNEVEQVEAVGAVVARQLATRN